MTTTRGKKKADHRTRVGVERTARTQKRILEAALGVFAAKGPDAPRIDDFVQAAGIARGTFYNHFESTDELLAATSEWMTRELVERIEAALEGIDGPALRLGVGLRLFFATARSQPVWCRFVARVWTVGGLELPLRDLDEGMRRGMFRAPGVAAARDLVLGGLREALLRMGTERTPSDYGTQMTQLLLQGLGADARLIASAMKHELPALPIDAARRRETAR